MNEEKARGGEERRFLMGCCVTTLCVEYLVCIVVRGYVRV